MTKLASFYTRPEPVILPGGRELWCSNQYRTNKAGRLYLHMTHWYQFEAHARRWYFQRITLADVRRKSAA